MTTICFIRHGETDWNAAGRLQGRTDISLNGNGIKQAKQCGVFLEKEDYDFVITSPLKRARETAEIINSYLKLPLVEMDDFVERSFGEAEGMTYEDRMNQYQDENFPNQEEQTVFYERVTKALEKVQHTYSKKRILLISHGAVINAILSILSKGKIGSRKTPLMNGCISNIHFYEDHWKIKNYNQVDHLVVDSP